MNLGEILIILGLIFCGLIGIDFMFGLSEKFEEFTKGKNKK